MKKGTLTTIHGPMFAGKTTYLVKIYGDGKGIVVFKPDLDKRYTKRPVVITHDKVEIPSVLVNNDKPEEMLELIDGSKTILIDEVNFFSSKLVEVVTLLLEKGINVYAAGLSRYADGDAWGPMNALIKIADHDLELTARCDGDDGLCQNPATRSYRKLPNMDKVQVAGVDEYGASCEQHYAELHHTPRR